MSGFELTSHLHLIYCEHFWDFFAPKRDVVYPTTKKKNKEMVDEK